MTGRREWRGDWLRTPLQTLVRYPWRSALTMLGLTIGVAAFIAMVSFGEGARQSVISQFQTLGTHVLIVTSSGEKRAAREQVVQPLTDRDVAALEREATTLAEVMPSSAQSADVGRAGLHHWTGLYGVTGAFTGIHEWPIAAGGMFSADDVARRAKVCVLGQTPLRELFAGQDPLGEPVTLAGALPCRVIGVLGAKGFNTSGEDLDNLVLIPTTTFLTYVNATPAYASLQLQPLAPALLDTAQAEVMEILRRSHRVPAGEEDFRVTSPLEVVRAVSHTSAILSNLLKAIAAVSLLVGGIGIMNIQLVSVAERTQEIGIRAAIGASPRQILTQFLSEALVLTLVGAAIGVGLGLAVATATAQLMQWPRVISTAGTFGSAGFAIAVGLLFGYLPARRAAQLDPIEALRHE